MALLLNIHLFMKYAPAWHVLASGHPLPSEADCRIYSVDCESQRTDYSGMKKKNIDALRKLLASEVKAARARAGLSQEALALAAAVDRTYVSQMERAIANPSIEILQRIADALGTKLVITFQSHPGS